MALDWRNDNTIRWLLQGNVTKVFKQIQAEAAPHGGIAMGDDVAAVKAEADELRDQIIAAVGDDGSITDYLLDLTRNVNYVVEGMGSFLGDYYTRYNINNTGVAGFWELMEAIQNEQIDTVTTLMGEIRMGIIHVPEEGESAPGEDTLGIAIGQKLQFSGRTWSDGSSTFYEISGNQTFAFYTSTGWQFWINGRKVGWYDSKDGMLHVVQIQSEGDIQFGNDPNKWLITEDGGWGIRYLGG